MARESVSNVFKADSPAREGNRRDSNRGRYLDLRRGFPRRFLSYSLSFPSLSFLRYSARLLASGHDPMCIAEMSLESNLS